MGGTHARLALFGRTAHEPDELEIYPSAEHGSLVEIVEAFRSRHPADIATVTIGVAGPVTDGRTEAVNLAWPVDARELASHLDLLESRVSVINDLEANAWGISVLRREDVAPLNEATGARDGNLALIAAGTGLGEAFVTVGPSGEEIHASEGGHVDFAPRSQLEFELRDHLAGDGEHVSYERVCSGMGLVGIYGFLRARSQDPEPEWLASERREGDEGAVISQVGLKRRDPVASDALDLMVSIYGAQAGNLSLTVMATGGVYVGGGIAPKILPRLQEGGFMSAFTDKGRLSDVLERIPVRVILNELTALLGAARHAQARSSGPAPSA